MNLSNSYGMMMLFRVLMLSKSNCSAEFLELRSVQKHT
jgi:hypothetical protein